MAQSPTDRVSLQGVKEPFSERAYGCSRHGYCITDGCAECADLLEGPNDAAIEAFNHEVEDGVRRLENMR